MNHSDKTVRRILLAAITMMGALFGFVGLDWDEGTHLHPDERFLTMATSAMEWPESWGDYFDESQSTLNPRNVGYGFFPYGTLPLTLTKGLASLLGMTEYGEVYRVGRGMSALAFVGSILFLFLLSRRVFGEDRIALLAAFLFACSVLPIQQAHFYTVDSICTFFILGAVYFLTKAQTTERVGDYLLTGVFFGLAMASKASIYTFALVVALVGSIQILDRLRDSDARIRWRGSVRLGGLLIVSGVCAFLVFRIASPDAFQGPGFFGMAPSERWLANLQEARRLVSGEVDFPPGHQWTDRAPVVFPLDNMVRWGLGPLLGLTAWIGWGAAVWVLYRRRSMHLLVPVLWVGVLFFHQGTQWVKSMRYFLPIYPLLALFAAWLLVRVWERCRRFAQNSNGIPRLGRVAFRAASLALVVVPLGTFLWGWAFLKIYLNPHPRIAASRWIHENIPQGSTLAGEHWDDSLPLPLRDQPAPATAFETVQFEWYAEDAPEKLEKCLEMLDRVDYIILSSNRLYDSIPRLPMRYPMTVKYYDALFAGELGFERAAEFTSYPKLLGIEFPDQGAEEAFSVYDHPRVQIFRKTESFSREKAESVLGEVEWERIVRLTPKQIAEGEYEKILRNQESPSTSQTAISPPADEGLLVPLSRSAIQTVRSWVSEASEPNQSVDDPAMEPRRSEVPIRLASSQGTVSAQPRSVTAASRPAALPQSIPIEKELAPRAARVPEEAREDRQIQPDSSKSAKGIPATFTPTATPTATVTPIQPTFTSTATATVTPVQPTFTPTATATVTPIQPTFTSTATATVTPVQPTFTSTATATVTPIQPTFTSTATATVTPTLPAFTPTTTATLPSLSTFTPTATATETPFLSTFTETETPMSTDTPSETASETATDTETETPTYSETPTETETPSFTPSETATWTPDFDIAPESPDGVIDSLDLLEWIERIRGEGTPGDVLFDFSRYWRTGTGKVSETGSGR